MKKVVLSLVIVMLVVAGMLTYVSVGDFTWNVSDILMFGGIIILVGFAILLTINRIRSAARKEAAEDEFSKKIMLKTSSLSYYISLYWWLAVSFFSEKSAWETPTVIGAGILGMALIFFFCWLYVKLNGLRDA